MRKRALIMILQTILMSPAPSHSETYRDTLRNKDYLKPPAGYRSSEMEVLYKAGYEARQKVENLLCRAGGTVKQCLDRKTSIKAIKDIGWSTIPYRDGFYIERTMLLRNRKIQYRWIVGSNGAVTPDNDKAIEITVWN